MRRVHAIELPADPDALAARQRALAGQVIVAGGDASARLVAALDVAYSTASHRAFAAVVVVERDTWREVERATWIGDAPHDYRSGAFSLREAGCLLPALDALSQRPDVLLVDGHGVAHPRRFGLACHLGLVFDIPAVGCAKNRLAGTHDPLGDEQGALAPLSGDDGQILGHAVRTRAGVKPVFVSPGHRFDPATAAQLVLSLSPRYRIPEPLRQAHHLSITLRAADPAR